MRSMRMTVTQGHPWTQVSGAYTTAPAWTWWAASAVTVPPDTQVCTARQTSMSVVQVPATQLIPGTACKTQGATSTASAILASQVGMTDTGQGPHHGPATVVEHPASACPGPRCQTALSPCESQPCQHGGQCRPSPGRGGGLTFTCHCVQVSGRNGGPWGKEKRSGFREGYVYKGKGEGQGVLRDAELWFGV